MTRGKKWRRVWQDTTHVKETLRAWGAPTTPPQTWGLGKYARLEPLPSLIRGASLLDVGCGFGHGYVLVRDRVKQYRGVDVAARVAVAKQHFPEGDFVVGDIYNLAGQGLYDTVAAIQVLIHLPTLEVPLQQLWACTAHTLIFTIWPTKGAGRVRVGPTGTLGHTHTAAELAEVFGRFTRVQSVESWSVPSKGRTIWYFRVVKGVPGVEVTPELFSGHQTKRWRL